jgi:hypothetical protein
MRETFCPAVCSVCDLVIFQECPELKKGHWEILGKGVKARTGVLPLTRPDESKAGSPSEPKASVS